MCVEQIFTKNAGQDFWREKCQTLITFEPKTNCLRDRIEASIIMKREMSNCLQNTIPHRYFTLNWFKVIISYKLYPKLVQLDQLKIF